MVVQGLLLQLLEFSLGPLHTYVSPLRFRNFWPPPHGWSHLLHLLHWPHIHVQLELVHWRFCTRSLGRHLLPPNTGGWITFLVLLCFPFLQKPRHLDQDPHWLHWHFLVQPLSNLHFLSFPRIHWQTAQRAWTRTLCPTIADPFRLLRRSFLLVRPGLPSSSTQALEIFLTPIFFAICLYDTLHWHPFFWIQGLLSFSSLLQCRFRVRWAFVQDPRHLPHLLHEVHRLGAEINNEVHKKYL